MTPDQRIERSRRPFETADADEVVDLFTPGASCQSNVFREPYVGSDAIRQYRQRGAGPSAMSPSVWDGPSLPAPALRRSGGRR
jgi:hypothetical protein